MIQKLRKIYPSLIVYEEKHVNFKQNYKWFITNQNEVIGIDKKELVQKDASLLAVFLTPYDIQFPILTIEEQKWYDMIHSTDTPIDDELKQSYRFVYFSMQENQIESSTFKDAIQELFSQQVPILWINGHEGIIIEEKTMLEERMNYDQIIDILMSDLYVKISFFVGPFLENVKNINHHYHSLIKAAQTVLSKSKNSVETYIDAVPYLLIDQSNPLLLDEMKQIILQEYLNDDDTLKMVETFVHLNLNMSETAKELYMHRNSLQYRIDRFYEKTGIDIRQFHQAMAVYLAILAKK